MDSNFVNNWICFRIVINFVRKFCFQCFSHHLFLAPLMVHWSTRLRHFQVEDDSTAAEGNRRHSFLHIALIYKFKICAHRDFLVLIACRPCRLSLFMSSVTGPYRQSRFFQFSGFRRLIRMLMVNNHCFEE